MHLLHSYCQLQKEPNLSPVHSGYKLLPEAIRDGYEAWASNDDGAEEPGHVTEELWQEDTVRLVGIELSEQPCNRAIHSQSTYRGYEHNTTS